MGIFLWSEHHEKIQNLDIREAWQVDRLTASLDYKIIRLSLLSDIVHRFSGFGKAVFVLTKTGCQDKQNTWGRGSSAGRAAD
jgi:hypothetical protein